MTFRGHVSSMGLDEVFALIAGNGLSGTLVLSTVRASVQLYFADGTMVIPRWITGLDESAPAPLIHARKRKCHKALQQLFACRDASYLFRPNDLPADLLAPTSLRFDPQAVIMDTARKRDETRRFERASTETQDSDVWGLAGKPRPVVQGELEGIGLPALLQGLRARHRTGTLKVSAGGRVERLYFDKGEAYVLRPEDSDGDFSRALLGAVGRASMRGLSGRCPAEDDPSHAARERFLEILFWEGASFRFAPDQLPTGFDVQRLPLQTDRFLMQAIQRLQAWEQLQGMLDGGGAVFRFLNPECKLRAIRERGAPDLLTLIDGLRSFADLVRLVDTPRLEAGELVADLFRRGHLVRCLRSAKGSRQPTTLNRTLLAAS